MDLFKYFRLVLVGRCSFCKKRVFKEPLWWNRNIDLSEDTSTVIDEPTVLGLNKRQIIQLPVYCARNPSQYQVAPVINNIYVPFAGQETLKLASSISHYRERPDSNNKQQQQQTHVNKHLFIDNQYLSLAENSCYLNDIYQPLAINTSH